ncbi:hypothetical protein SLA2020_125700 [Shorea laevis]
MSKQEVMKMQTWVLKVNIQCQCEGCEQKVEKLLRKIDGVYSTSIDSERGKVTVTGNVDPAILIKKLEKSGKHAQLWGAQKGFQNLSNQFKNMHLEGGKGGKDNKSHKGGNNQQKGGQNFAAQQIKGGNNQQKDQKSVRFALPEDEFDASDDYYDEDEDEFDELDDEFDEDFDDDMEDFGHGHDHGHGPNGFSMNSKKGGGGGDFSKKGAIDMHMVMKGKGENKETKGGKGGKKGGSGGGKQQGKGGGDKKGGKKSGGGGFLGFLKRSKSGKESSGKKGKNGDGNNKSSKSNNGNVGGGGGKNNGNGSKKGGGKNDGSHEMNKMKNGGSHEVDVIHHGRGGGGGGGGGKHMDQMGQMAQMGNFAAVQGLPAGAAMNGGAYYQGMGAMNPYTQQQYMAMLMNNQHRPIGNDMYQSMMYARPYPYANYGPPPMPPPVPAEPYAHYFSDENPESCSIM